MESVEYMGDGVYAVYDGLGIELRANDHKFPTASIYLEPFVLDNIIRFRQKNSKEKYD